MNQSSSTPALHQAPDLPYNAILCRYSEIATKGRNRGHFERLLIESLHRQLPEMTPFRAGRERGRIVIRPKDRQTKTFNGRDIAVLHRDLERVFGISSASPVMRVSTELSEIEAAVDRFFPAVYEAATGRLPEGRIGYAMRARRSHRAYPLRSHELELHFAHRLLPVYPRLGVNLDDPDILLQLEVREEAAFLSFVNFPGPGGLPVGSAGRALVLLSGGIDSPVAAYQAMRRGCPLDYITFHSAPYTPEAGLRKVAALARRLDLYQGSSRLFCVNLLPAQKAIRDLCNPRYRTVLYRRLMLRIACRLAARHKLLALVTGDNLGQVASQTMENLFVINQVADRPVFRPLLTWDKNQTVALARRIGTYELSQQEVPDSCTVFAPRRPATMAEPEKIKREEESLDLEGLIAGCLAESVRMEPATGESVPL